MGAYSPKTLMDVWATSGQVDHTYDVGYRANYRWNADRSVDHDVQVYARDSDGLVTATRFHVDVTNIPPTVTVPDQTTLEGTVSLDFAVTDPGQKSGETLRAQWQIVNPANGETIVSDWFWSLPPSFSLAAGTYDITLLVQDSEVTRSDGATLTVINAPPVVGAGPDAAGPMRSVPLNGSVSDTGTLFGKSVSAHWTVTDAAGTVVGQSDALNWTFHAPEFGVYTAVLTATDQDGAVSSDSAVLDLYNITPTVNAGADVQGELWMVPLSGVVSDPGTAFGEIVTWHWVVTDASDAVVAESDLLAWTFPAPGFGTYTAVLTATDQYGATASDAATLNLFNIAPAADAGPDANVEPGVPATLVGAFTDPGLESGEGHRTQWMIRNSAGLPVAVQAGSTVTFTTRTAGEYTAVFTVTDEYGAVATDICTITVAPILPVVNAGADVTIDLHNGPVTVTGSFTDPVGKPNETYTVGWVVTNSGGTQVATGTGLSIAYTPAAAGTYTATLSVTDSDGNRGSDALTISVAQHFDVEPGPAISLYLESGSASTGTITVARFLDLDWSNRPVDHFATPTIAWGDGTTSPGTLTYTAAWTTFRGRQVFGYYTVQGSHTYTQHSYGQPNQVYSETTSIVGLPDGRNNYERRALIQTTASINTHAVVMVSMTVNPATPELGQPAGITFTFGDGPESSSHLLWIWWKDEANWWSGHRYDIAPGQRSITVPHTFSTDFYSHSYSVWVGGHVQRGSSGTGYTNVSYMDAQVSKSVTVLPAQPRVDAGSDVSMEQGQTVVLSGTVSNWSGYTAAWQVTDESSGSVAATGSGTALAFTPAASARYQAVFTATSGGATLSDSLQIDVANVAPSVSASFVANDDGSADLAGSFTDPGQTGGELYGAIWRIYDQHNLLVASAEALDFHFMPPEPGKYQAVLTVTDDESASGSTTLQLQLPPNTPPIAMAGNAYEVDEGGTVVLDGSGSQDAEQSAESLNYVWDLDDDGIYGETGDDAGRGDETGMCPQFSAVSLDGPGTWTVRLRVTDDRGESSEDAAIVTIGNVAPHATIAGAVAETAEGTPINLTSSVVDPGIADTFSYAWSVTKDGNPFASGSAAGFSFTPDDNGIYVVNLTVTDDDLGVGTDSRTVTVTNVAPVVEAGENREVAEGATISLAPATFTDAGSGDTHTATINWGDGSPVEAGSVTETAGSGTVTGSHVYADNGAYTVTVTVTDDDGGSHADTLTATVTNVAPSDLQLSLSLTEIDEHGRNSLSGIFVDPGVLDAHTVTIDWNDGGPMQTLNLPAGITSFPAVSHRFFMHRPYGESYVIRVTVADEADSVTSTIHTVWPWADYGDAPDSYQTLLASDGARHRFGSELFLGTAVDAEHDGQPTDDSLADDTHDGDDEDGVSFGPILRQGRAATVRVTASQAARLDAFLDFNADGDFADAGEKIFDNVAVDAGDNDFSFLVPADAASAVTYARFRLSSAGGLDFTGLAADGEVEDYRVTVGLYNVRSQLADDRYWVDVYNATPGSMVVFAYGTERGTWPLPQPGLTLNIASPTYFAVGGTDTAGHAAAVLPIPPSLVGHTLYVQAFEQLPSPQVAPICVINPGIPTASVSRAGDQPQRTSHAPVHFTVTFSEPVTDFAAEDVSLVATAAGDLVATVTGGPATYDVAVSGMTGSGTVTLRVAAGVAHDQDGNPNSASAGEDNFVVFLANPWQNYPSVYDVSGDDLDTPLDVLMLINWINTHGAGPLPADPGTDPVYVDVDGNGLVSPLDVLLVINRLNRRLDSQVAGEGEAGDVAAAGLSADDWATISVPMQPGSLFPSTRSAEVVDDVWTQYAQADPLARATGEVQIAPEKPQEAEVANGKSADEGELLQSEWDDLLADLAEDVCRGWGSGPI